jgi:hypothetical protein
MHLKKIHQIILSVKEAIKAGDRVIYLELSQEDYEAMQCDYRRFVEMALPLFEHKQP